MSTNDTSNVFDMTYFNLATQSAGLVSNQATTFSVFNGLNILGGMPPMPLNSDNQGYCFFTRPCLNLSYNNIMKSRKLMFLANTDKYSMNNAIRCMLNPPGYDNSGIKGATSGSAFGDNSRSVIYDDKSAFCNILNNLCMNLSGWPDVSPSTYTTDAGISGEQIGFHDTRPDILGEFTLQSTFLNIEGDPITNIFTTWIEYAQQVYQGSMSPFPINIIANRIDYTTRIYRLVMDKTKTYVQRIAATGGAFPNSIDIGARFNFSYDNVNMMDFKEISVPFTCFGAIFNDPILILEFNGLVERFNPAMKGKSGMQKLSGMFIDDLNAKAIFNYKSYPYIAASNELEWYVDKNIYNTLKQAVQKSKDEITKNTSNNKYKISPWEDLIIQKTKGGGGV